MNVKFVILSAKNLTVKNNDLNYFFLERSSKIENFGILDNENEVLFKGENISTNLQDFSEKLNYTTRL